METALSGIEPVGFAWLAILGFLRISTRRGALTEPLHPAKALYFVEVWLNAANARIVHPSEHHFLTLRRLLEQSGTAGNLTTDAHLAALAIEHGAELVSFDRDFVRFEGLRTAILKA
jgi:toxin-antitoxin system PIN domain toxin